MRHRKAGKHLNRTPAHRLALLRNLCRALITHERIVTTLPKAKWLRPQFERLITFAKRAAVIMDGPGEEKERRVKALHFRRLAMARLGPVHGTGIYDKKDEQLDDPLSGGKSFDTVLKKLFRELGPRFKDRPGGYTRVIKQHYRRLGDGGATAIIEILKPGETKVRLKERKPAAPAPAPLAPAGQ